MTSVLYVDRLNCSQPSHIIRFGLLFLLQFFSLHIFDSHLFSRVSMCACISMSVYLSFFTLLLSSPHSHLPSPGCLRWMIRFRSWCIVLSVSLLLLFSFLVFCLIRWLCAFCVYELMRARLFQCVYISTILCLLFGFAAVQCTFIYFGSVCIYMHTHGRSPSCICSASSNLSFLCLLYSLLVSQTYTMSDFSLMQGTVYSFTPQPSSHSPANLLTMIFWIQHQYSLCAWAHFGF